MKKYIIVKADTNDADYVTEQSEIDDSIIEEIKPVVEAIKNFQSYKGEWSPGNFTTHDHNFPYGDGEYTPRKDMGEKSSEELYGHIPGYKTFEALCPYGEYGIHTIESVDIITDSIKLL